ncbi:MAG: ATP-binding protein [Chloroflexota bacterium]
MALLETLRGCDLFRELSDEELGCVARISRLESYPAGTTILVAGAVVTNLYVVASGRVALEIRVQIGSRVPRDANIETLEPGGAFGVSVLVPPYTSAASARCLESVRVVVVDGDGLRKLVEANTGLGLKLMRQINATVSKRRDEAVERLEYFVSIVSHELKAPLAAVESYIQFMMSGYTGRINERQRNALQRCSVRVRELLGLVSDLVESSQLEARSIAQSMEEASLQPIIELSLEDVQTSAKEKNIKLRVSVPPTLPPVFVAPGRMRQVFTNLLANAVKYTPDGGSVTLKVERTNQHIQLEVIDSGVGIPANELPRVFEEFYRGSNVDDKGAGLGLAVARKIVEAHGGQIWAESPYPPARGKGSRFCVRLPLPDQGASKGEAVELDVKENGASQLADGHAHRKGRRWNGEHC